MEQNQIPEKDRIITNLIFRLGDILYSLMYENLEAMNKLGFDLKGQTKLRFQKLMVVHNEAKKAYLNFTKDIEGLTPDEIDQFTQDSDVIRQFILLITDKTLGRPENIEKAWDILYSLPSDNVLELPKNIEL
mgnify:FL=1